VVAAAADDADARAGLDPPGAAAARLEARRATAGARLLAAAQQVGA
jgi:hypothetical protein